MMEERLTFEDKNIFIRLVFDKKEQLIYLKGRVEHTGKIFELCLTNTLLKNYNLNMNLNGVFEMIKNGFNKIGVDSKNIFIPKIDKLNTIYLSNGKTDIYFKPSYIPF
jgi:hypothetical protein